MLTDVNSFQASMSTNANNFWASMPTDANECQVSLSTYAYRNAYKGMRLQLPNLVLIEAIRRVVGGKLLRTSQIFKGQHTTLLLRISKLERVNWLTLPQSGSTSVARWWVGKRFGLWASWRINDGGEVYYDHDKIHDFVLKISSKKLKTECQ